MSDQQKPIGPFLPSNFQSISSNQDAGKKRYVGPTMPDRHDLDQNAQYEDLSSLNTEADEGSLDEGILDAFGPALPPGFSNTNDCVPEDDDDDTFGPVPDGQEDKNHMYDVSARNLKKAKQITKREKWMLEPGKAMAKTIQTKSVTKFSQKSSKKDAPLTKEQKLEMEMVAEKEGKMRAFLDKFETSHKRDVSLLEQHRGDLKNNKKLKVEKTERREFDRDKDLNISKMDGKKRNGFIKEASTTFPTRFASGKFEKFL